MGTRSYTYDSPLPEDQVQLVEWCLDNIQQVLELQSSDRSVNWTSRWLEILKQHAAKGFHPEIPQYGFGDGKSYGIVTDAVASLKQTGAVRHGAESFNFYFPQELDEEFLIVSKGSFQDQKVPWRYVNAAELQEFLLERISEGFTFPLNPKWILCDPNWKPIYDSLMETNRSDVQKSLKVWYPPSVREKIESIHKQFPDGFVFEKDKDADPSDMIDGTEAMDLATLELEQFLTLRRAKVKMLCVAAFNKLLQSVREKHARR
uniref:Uncharacterized protein n=1 Tax=Entomoneis paludosa TaxID=265537 RepID=A0A7S2YKR8_9STRA